MDVSYRTTLELDKIIARAVQLCTCAETKEMMRAIEPFATTEEERYALAQTNAINALLLKNGSPRFGAVHEVRRVVAHAAKGGNCCSAAQFFRPGPVVRPDRPRYAAHR